MGGHADCESNLDESYFDENDENQHLDIFYPEKKLPAIDFSESHKRARFNFERLCQKYEKMEESGIEIDLRKDIVYAPQDMSLPKYKKNIDKFANFSMNFGSSSAGAAVGNTMGSYDNDSQQYVHSLRLNALFRRSIGSPRMNKWKQRRLSKLVHRSRTSVKAEVNRVIKKKNYDSEVDFEMGAKWLSEPLDDQCKSEQMFKTADDWSTHTVDSPGSVTSIEHPLFPTNCSVKSGCLDRDEDLVDVSKSNEKIPDDLINEELYYSTNCSVKSGCLEEYELDTNSIAEDDIIIDEEMIEHCYETNCSVKSGCIEPLRKKLKLKTSHGGSVRSGCVKSEDASESPSDVTCKDDSEDAFQSSILFEPDASDFWNQPLYVLLSSYPSTAGTVFGCKRRLCETLSEDPTTTLLETWVETATSGLEFEREDYVQREERQIHSRIQREAQRTKGGYKFF